MGQHHINKPVKYKIVFYPSGPNNPNKVYEDATNPQFSNNTCFFDYDGKRVIISGSYIIKQQ